MVKTKGNLDLGGRMKEYEYVNRSKLMRRTPVIIRLDGRSFSTFTKGLEKPYDKVLMNSMVGTAQELCNQIQGCKIAYTQSDEISLLLVDYENIGTSAWFDNNIMKMVSISASIATLEFNRIFREEIKKISGELSSKDIEVYKNKEMKALFDSRVFNLPIEEVINYFIWRQQDCIKNSVSMVAQAYYSHRELHRKNGENKKEMLLEKGLDWNTLESKKRRGVTVVRKEFDIGETTRMRWVPDYEIPLFTEDREYINKLVIQKKERV